MSVCHKNTENQIFFSAGQLQGDFLLKYCEGNCTGNLWSSCKTPPIELLADAVKLSEAEADLQNYESRQGHWDIAFPFALVPGCKHEVRGVALEEVPHSRVDQFLERDSCVSHQELTKPTWQFDYWVLWHWKEDLGFGAGVLTTYSCKTRFSKSIFCKHFIEPSKKSWNRIFMQPFM